MARLNVVKTSCQSSLRLIMTTLRLFNIELEHNKTSYNYIHISGFVETFKNCFRPVTIPEDELRSLGWFNIR